MKNNIKCPKCNRKCVSKGALRLHLITKAKQEVYEWFSNLDDKDYVELTPLESIKDSDMPHQIYVEANKMKVSYEKIKV